MGFGLAFGLSLGWADRISQSNRIKAAEAQVAELGGELNAMRVMAEWERFEEGRGHE